MDALAVIIVAAHATVVVSLFVGIVTCFAQARIAIAALEAIARQPEAAPSVQRSMIVGLAMSETVGIYGLLIALLMLFANPLITIYTQYMMYL